jgi:hypothetical protein
MTSRKQYEHQLKKWQVAKNKRRSKEIKPLPAVLQDITLTYQPPNADRQSSLKFSKSKVPGDENRPACQAEIIESHNAEDAVTRSMAIDTIVNESEDESILTRSKPVSFSAATERDLCHIGTGLDAMLQNETTKESPESTIHDPTLPRGNVSPGTADFLHLASRINAKRPRSSCSSLSRKQARTTSAAHSLSYEADVPSGAARNRHSLTSRSDISILSLARISSLDESADTCDLPPEDPYSWRFGGDPGGPHSRLQRVRSVDGQGSSRTNTDLESDMGIIVAQASADLPADLSSQEPYAHIDTLRWNSASMLRSDARISAGAPRDWKRSPFTAFYSPPQDRHTRSENPSIGIQTRRHSRGSGQLLSKLSTTHPASAVSAGHHSGVQLDEAPSTPALPPNATIWSVTRSGLLSLGSSKQQLHPQSDKPSRHGLTSIRNLIDRARRLSTKIFSRFCRSKQCS